MVIVWSGAISKYESAPRIRATRNLKQLDGIPRNILFFKGVPGECWPKESPYFLSRWFINKGRMMILEEYLKTRGVKVNALVKREAKLLGIDWPLTKGWAEEFADMEISPELENRLRTALKSRREKTKSWKKKES
jgi:hypothetical protein